MWNKIKPYAGFIALSLGVGGLAALITRGNMDIYDEIVMPPLSPPSWLFPVVWTILYTLMGISAGMIYSENKINKQKSSPLKGTSITRGTTLIQK